MRSVPRGSSPAARSEVHPCSASACAPLATSTTIPAISLACSAPTKRAPSDQAASRMQIIEYSVASAIIPSNLALTRLCDASRGRAVHSSAPCIHSRASATRPRKPPNTRASSSAPPRPTKKRVDARAVMATDTTATAALRSRGSKRLAEYRVGPRRRTAAARSICAGPSTNVPTIRLSNDKRSKAQLAHRTTMPPTMLADHTDAPNALRLSKLSMGMPAQVLQTQCCLW
mmetsp:Transcript_49759/g.142861  ORF Transcript_49759/g.142861 Transcript_49759/m.142861 type:complete len:230 (+) Transcript_49759:1071-1760(+)